VRIIAEDPYVAIAPEATIAPAVEVPTIETARATTRPAHAPEALELPKISYPEITPADQPLAERAGPGRGRRSLQVAVAILVLAAGGYLAKSFYSPVQQNGSAPSEVRADRPALPQDGAAAATTPASDARTAAAASPAGARPTPRGAFGAPAVPSGMAGAPLAPASSGFAAALEPRAMTSGPVPNLPASSDANVPPIAAKPDSATTIAPPPADLRIDVPALPGGVPFVAGPSGKDDSAMKRILRAVNGGKDAK
jgi:hypothetical protein